MSTTTSRPVWKRPGATTCPTFGAWKVTVTDARTAAPATFPVDASTPEGRSTDTTGAVPSFSSAIISAAARRGVPANPVPKSASTCDVRRTALVHEGDAGLLRPREHDRRVARELLLRPEQAHGTLLAGTRQLARGHEPVPAVGAGSAPDRDPLRPRVGVEQLLGNARAGAPHQLQRRARIRGLGGAHLLGRVERLALRLCDEGHQGRA
jgi:hypothetical protein